jgi:uncharacterized protein (DUF362 family)
MQRIGSEMYIASLVALSLVRELGPVIAALVKILKKTGAFVKVGEQAAWHFDTDEAFEVTGIRKAALEAGADEIVNWKKDERVAVKIPDPHIIPWVMDSGCAIAIPPIAFMG